MNNNGTSRQPISKAGLAQQSGFIGAVYRFWSRSYAPDYLGSVLLITAHLLMGNFMEPFHRMFSLDDLSISFPHAKVERVPPLWEKIYAGVIPLVVILIWTIITRPGVHPTNVSILGLLISIALTVFITDVFKNAVGRPRPDLLDRCKPAKATPQHSLVTIAVCTETDPHTLQDGWRSFPSGHSSFAFAGLGFLALFLAGQMHIFRPRTDVFRVLFAMAPLLGAALIAISRLEDYRHGYFDVTCGSILGFSVAYFSYRRYFPALYLARCHEPYPSRGATATLQDRGRVRDEEDLAQRESSADDPEDSERLPLNDVGRAHSDDHLRGSE